MIDFSIDESDELIRSTVAWFAEDNLAPNIRGFESAREVTPTVRKAWESLGLNGLELPEALGGSGSSMLTRALINEELGAVDPGATLNLDRIGPAAYPLLAMATEDEIRQLLAPIMEDPGKRALLVYTPASSISRSGKTVSGRVPFVPAAACDLLVCLDTTGAFVVNRGLTFNAIRGSGLRAAAPSELLLDNAPVSHRWENPVGAAKAIAQARIYYGSLLLGVLRKAAQFSREYARERIVFGKPVAHHQAMAFLITDMNPAVTAARLHLHYACTASNSFKEAAATAFAEVAEQSTFVGPNSVQILGGVGFMQDYPVEKYMREARALSLLLGGTDAARDDALSARNAFSPIVEGVL